MPDDDTPDDGRPGADPLWSGPDPTHSGDYDVDGGDDAGGAGSLPSVTDAIDDDDLADAYSVVAEAVKPSHRARNRTVGGGSLVAAVVVAVLVIPGARDKLPASVPLVGRDANTVYAQIKRAGLPVTDGEPSSDDFRQIVHNNGCKSSRSFVRTDNDDVGWGVICVKPPGEAYRRMSDAFQNVPLLAGPLYVDDGGGEVIIFGFGWPTDASKTIYDAIDGNGGTYLVEQDSVQ